MKMLSYYPRLVASNNVNENLVVFAIGNLVKKRLNNMWHLVKFELCLYIIIANVLMLMASYCMQHVMLTYIA